MLTAFIIASSDNSLLFLYLRQKLGWTLTKYSLFSSITSGIGVASTVFWVYIVHKKIGCSENNLITAGLIVTLKSTVLYAIASNDWFIYVGSALRCFGSASTAMGRSIVSKVTSTDETGKVFSLIAAISMISGFISSPMYTWVYDATLSTFSGAYNLCSSGFYGVALVLIV